MANISPCVSLNTREFCYKLGLFDVKMTPNTVDVYAIISVYIRLYDLQPLYQVR